MLIQLTAPYDAEARAIMLDMEIADDIEADIEDLVDAHTAPEELLNDEGWLFSKLVDQNGNTYTQFSLPVDFSYLQNGRLYGGYGMYVVDFTSLLETLRLMQQDINNSQPVAPEPEADTAIANRGWRNLFS